MLHLIRRSPQQLSTWQQVFSMMSDGDVLILLGDAVYAVLDEQALNQQLPDCCQYRVLNSDALARGILQQVTSEHLIDYEQFVALSVKHSQSVSW